MPPKIQIKRTKTDYYPEKFTKEKHLTVNIKRKNKPDITLERHTAKNKNTGAKLVTRRKLTGDWTEGKPLRTQTTIKQRDTAGNKTKLYKSTGNKLADGATYYKGEDKSKFKAANKTNRGVLNTMTRKEADTKKVMKKMAKTVAPIMKRMIREGNEEAKQNIMNGVRKNVERKYPSYKSKP